MHNESFHRTLSPQAHAALFDAIHRQARRERRLAVQRFGQSWPAQLRRILKRLAASLLRAAVVTRSVKA
jgi:hypothetical protein